MNFSQRPRKRELPPMPDKSFEVGDIVRLKPDVDWLPHVRKFVGKPLMISKVSGYTVNLKPMDHDTWINIYWPKSNATNNEFAINCLTHDTFMNEVRKARRNDKEQIKTR